MSCNVARSSASTTRNVFPNVALSCSSDVKPHTLRRNNRSHRPTVVFAYGEREQRTKLPAEHDTVAIIDPIPPQTRLTLDLTADPAPNADMIHPT